MDILDDMGVSKLSAKVFLKVNYSFNKQTTAGPKLKFLPESSMSILAQFCQPCICCLLNIVCILKYC